ncbi:hypothetical protein E2P81_ATG10344 [Venturia nashicola]|nr:hypothetical protein E2P81_ATG10344 [Venturia nashicola]
MKLFNIILTLALVAITNASAFERFWLEGQQIKKDGTCAEWWLYYCYRDENGDHYGYFPLDWCFESSVTISDGGHFLELNGVTYEAKLTDASSYDSISAQLDWSYEGSDNTGVYYCYFAEGPDVTTNPRWAPNCDYSKSHLFESNVTRAASTLSVTKTF